MNNLGNIIIGAGPAGLSAAYELGRLGSSALVLEASGEMGGLARTVNYQGYRFDIGGHRFFSKREDINLLWQEILGEAFLQRPRLSRIHYRGHFFDYPLRPLNALLKLGPWESLRILGSYARAHLASAPDEDGSFEEWVSRRFGKRLFEIFFKTYTEKVWGIPCRDISADWAAQRIRDLSLSKALSNAFGGHRKRSVKDISTTLIERFHYPRFGPGMMWEHMAEGICEKGNQIRAQVRVGTLRHHRGRVHQVSGRGPDSHRIEIPVDHCISTMALRDLILSLDPPPPDDVLRAARALRYRDFLSVVLIVNQAAVFPDNWIYIHSPEVKLGRIQNYKNWSPHMVPDPATTALGLEYFLWDSDPEWNWSDERLIALGIRECGVLGLVRPEQVLDGTVVRAEMAYPIYDHEYQDHVRLIRDYLSAFKNLQTIGRNGLHRYNNMDHSMLTGLYAARNVLEEGERRDVWSVNMDKSYHETDEQDADADLLSSRAVPVSRIGG